VDLRDMSADQIADLLDHLRFEPMPPSEETRLLAELDAIDPNEPWVIVETPGRAA
jgi:hypothetical protein